MIPLFYSFFFLHTIIAIVPLSSFLHYTSSQFFLVILTTVNVYRVTYKYWLHI